MADVSYEDWVIFPTTRVRVEFSTERGDVQWFVVQLEYDMDWDYDPETPSEWLPVARFDHSPESETGHDIRSEGLHLDILRWGEKERVQYGFPPVPVNRAPAWCQNYLEEHAEHYVSRFERWHGVNGPRR